MSRWDYVLAFFPPVVLMLAGVFTEGADGWIILGIGMVLLKLQVREIDDLRHGRVEVHIEPSSQAGDP